MSWKQFGIKERHFTFGKNGKRLSGQIYNNIVIGSWGATRKGTETTRYYNLYDFLFTYNVMSQGRNRILVGVGATHRKGGEDYAQRIFIKPTHREVLENVRSRDEWGGIIEASCDHRFWKLLTIGAQAGYRFYPTGDGTLYAGFTSGIRIGR